MFAKLTAYVFLASSIATTLSAPIQQREVPQEHSHEKILVATKAALDLNNPDKIQDTVFGLLGDVAGAKGKGLIADVTCLQQATADRAFTNAKKAGDIEAMTNALIYRTLERNSGTVGQKTDLCTSIKAANPEIAALTQHQDPASDGAAAGNKEIALNLAKQIASIGGDPLRAIDSGTFAPGDKKDPTGAGKSCDTVPDPIGCIFTQKLLVPDVTAAEITAAVAGVKGGAAAGAKGGNNAAAEKGAADAKAAGKGAEAAAAKDNKGAAAPCPPAETKTVTVAPAATAAASACPAQATVTVTVTAGAQAAAETGAAKGNGKGKGKTMAKANKGQAKAQKAQAEGMKAEKAQGQATSASSQPKVIKIRTVL